ncbi:hypothetical protein [Cryobacterium gelidum]|uniref:Uncharacterized protein n=1 Tax=Cryobacterium gelidum TaxID=1259164 RepID=A0A4R9AYV0_9MICO|nr:hypothetical protein [Cryobacterium gelidum]TFD72942.1 hypothetical protein E3T50_03635 [Cryobacterium gelidum]
MIADKDIIRILQSLDSWWCANGRKREEPYDYRITDVVAGEGFADIELQQRDGLTARLVVSLVSSDSPQYWLYAPPANAEDWVNQLLIWIDEEVFTLGLGASRSRTASDGVSYVSVEPYGWRRSDEHDHLRLKAAAGPEGWNGNIFD